ncbi:MAG: Do family serine endopeptidase [Hyphomicrobiaceae bacterium]
MSALTPRFSIARSKRILLAGVAAAFLAGGALAELRIPAFAEETQATGVATAYGTAPISFADVVDRVKGAVVSVYVTNASPVAGVEGLDAFPELPDDHPLNEFFKRFKKGQGSGEESTPAPAPSQAQGSGFIISEDGYIVTNNHVVDGASTVQVSIDDDKKYEADVIGTDPRTDLALLKVKGSASFTQIVHFSEKDPRVGDWVIAVGNPFGLGGTVTAGIISAHNRDIGSGPYDFLQIDAAVNRGNSGGPAFNLEGEVIGINTAIFSPSGGNVGIAFAVPADLAKQVVEQLKSTGSVSRGWLGVHIQNVTDDIAQSLGMEKPTGALVSKIQEDGPAAKSELDVGDVVVSVNGETIGNSRDLARKVADLAPDTDAQLVVVRDGREVPLTIKLGQFPGSKQVASLDKKAPAVAPETSDLKDLGLSLAPASTLSQEGGQAQDGVLITRVGDGSEASAKGLQSGDIILEVAGDKVMAPSDVSKSIDGAKAKGRKAVLLRVKTGDQERFVALTLGKV